MKYSSSYIARASLPAITTLFAVFLYNQPALAQAPCEMDPSACPKRLDAESARGVGTGLGLRATAVSTSALAYNPGGLAGAPLYHIEGNVDYLGGSKTVALGAAVADSSTSRVAGGLSLRGFLSGDKGGYDGIDGRLALAFPFSDFIAIGVAGRYVDIGTESLDAAGEYQDQNLVKGFSLDASAQINAGDMFHMTLAAYNFVDHQSALMPVMAGASVAIAATDILVLGVDSLLDFTTFDTPKVNLGAAVEVLAGQSFPLRAGYAYDTGRRLHQVSGGVGYTDTIVGLDVSLRQDIAGGKDTCVMGAIRFYIN